MIYDMISFFWKLSLVVLCWWMICKGVKPRTSLLMRIVRAFLILIAMILVLTVTKTIGV
ncbi:hypothetical protein LCGC14_1415120 [marine sediment metagenome]|uniref:Uncharacterized protein n=1 Tax=marine sediment metagenome TaxID=412755 RepID=A0A0F9MUT6_9ZZZZ